MRIDAPRPGDIEQIARSMRGRDLEELEAIYPVNGRQDVADYFIEAYRARPDLICGYVDKYEPVAIGMLLEGRPNVVTLGFIATDRFPEILVPAAKFIRQRLFSRVKKAGCHRIETVTIDGYDETHRWLKMLGLSREATHRNYGKLGQTFHTYAWIKENVRQTGDGL